MNEIIDISEREGFWTLSAEIITKNRGSRALFTKCGFREVGIREHFGHINNEWHDVVLMERRSQHVGGPNLPSKKCDKAT